MAFNYGWRGPTIVSEGLILYLDAGSPNSYRTEFGSTWKDISGYGYNGTLVNSPTYSSLNGGNFLFDKTNDYVNLGNVIGSPTNFTIDVWVRNTTSGQGGILSKGLVNDNNEWGLTFGYSNPTLIVARYKSPTQQLTFPWTGYTTGFHNIVYAVSGSNSSSLYVDNVLVASNSITASPGANTENLQVAYHGVQYYFDGNIAIVRMYNTTLNTTQINQNFNALRTRFDL